MGHLHGTLVGMSHDMSHDMSHWNVPRVCPMQMRPDCPVTTMNRIEYARHAGGCMIVPRFNVSSPQHYDVSENHQMVHGVCLSLMVSYRESLSLRQCRCSQSCPPTPLNFSIKETTFWNTVCFFVLYCGFRGLSLGRASLSSVPFSVANSCFRDRRI